MNAAGKTDRNRKAAGRARLQYVSDRLDGIKRHKRGNGFSYTYRDSPVKDQHTLQRIKRLAIPPAWKDVWICHAVNGHIQATGFDALNRKQYRYHPEWNKLRGEKKFNRLRELGQCLPAIRKRIMADLSRPRLTKQKVLATAVSLIQETSIRVGNNEYERRYGSYGLTTLKDNHASINGQTIRFSFKGKKGIHQIVTLRNKRLARIVKACKEIPGRELFQFLDEEGHANSIDSGMVNDYIRNAADGDFTAKDLRTWCGTLAMLDALRQLPPPGQQKEAKKNIISALDHVSSQLGNSRAICRGYYVHPGIISLYENGNLPDHRAVRNGAQLDGLTRDERYLMKVLEKIQ